MREARVPTLSRSQRRPVHALLRSVLAVGDLGQRSRHRVRFLQLLVGGLLTLGVLGMHSLPAPPTTETKNLTTTAELAPATLTPSISKAGEASEHSAAATTEPAAATTAATAAVACHETGDAGHGTHGAHGGHGGDSGDAGCGGHDVLMLCIALVVGIASVLIALGLLSARPWRPLFIAPRWSALLQTPPSPQLFSPPWARRDLTCVHRC